MSVLKIYKASAGSGKTYRLTGEYIDLLFQNPFHYQHILAVTFTNKASAEMKSRIIDQLFRISQGLHTGYSNALKNKHKLNDTTLQERASTCLNLILHDYSKFSIETIDRFFQKIILSFIREMGLQTGFTIELDTDNVLNDVIGDLMFGIENDDQLKKWLIRFAENKVEEGKNWNFKNDLATLGKEIFKESFKISKNAILAKTSDKDFLGNFMAELYAYKKQVEKKLSEIGSEALSAMETWGLSPQDFAQGERGIGGFFRKLAAGDYPDNLNNYVTHCIEDETAWSTKSSVKKVAIGQVVANRLMRLLTDAAKIYGEQMPVYFSINNILPFLPALGIITDISKRIKDHTDANNSFLISDAAEFLYQITGTNESPFI
jgi:ATP-dependent helicase/nuclease subunit A